MDKAFVLTAENAVMLGIESEIIFPYAYRGEEVNRHLMTEPNARVIYPYKESENGKPELINEDIFKSKYPNAYNYLLVFKELLEQRMDSRNLYATGKHWYRHLRAGTFNYIKTQKLIFKGVDLKATVGYLSNNMVFNGANCPAIIPIVNCPVSLQYLAIILNSKLSTYFLNSVCPKKLGGYYRYNATNLSTIPIVIGNKQHQEIIEAKAYLIEALSEKFRKEVDIFTILLLSKFEIEKLTTKLQNWYELDTKEFLIELKKAKVQLSLSAEADWMQYFIRQMQIAQALKSEIAKTDKEIDRMVYELYGLTVEEIKIVEGTN